MARARYRYGPRMGKIGVDQGGEGKPDQKFEPVARGPEEGVDLDVGWNVMGEGGCGDDASVRGRACKRRHQEYGEPPQRHGSVRTISLHDQFL